MTSSHTLATITADLIANGVPKRDEPFASQPDSSPFCWFVLPGQEPHERWLTLRNPNTTTELHFNFVCAYNPADAHDPLWHLESAMLMYQLPGSLLDRETEDYDHTSIRSALVLLSFIDRHNAKHGIPTP